MSGKTILGVVITGFVLFIFGFIYWAMNPLPYQSWNELSDPAAVQRAAAELFPEDGMYFVPGAGNDPEALKLLETGPSVYLTIDHSPTAGADPVALATGFVHNILSALLLVLVLRNISGTASQLGTAALIGFTATFVINGSEIIWWQQPFNWMIHHAIYYVAYFVIGAAVLGRFLEQKN